MVSFDCNGRLCRGRRSVGKSHVCLHHLYPTVVLMVWQNESIEAHGTVNYLFDMCVNAVCWEVDQ